MLNKKTDFPQSQSVQSGVDNEPILFDREFLLENGQTDVHLFGDDYFVLDVGAAISADDFRTQTPGPDKFFITSLAKRVFVDLEEMRRTAFVKDILYFLDVPNYQQALFVSKENAGETITISQCRGIASAISLFDWNTLIKDLSDVIDLAQTNVENLAKLSAVVDTAKGDIVKNSEAIKANALDIDQRQIMPNWQNWFLTQSGEGNILRPEPVDSSVGLTGSLTFEGGIPEPFLFLGDVQLFLRLANSAPTTEPAVSAPITVKGNGTVLGSAVASVPSSAGETFVLNIKIPSIKIDASAAYSLDPYPLSLQINLPSGVSLIAGGINTPSVMQLQGGGGSGVKYAGKFDTFQDAVTAITNGDMSIGDYCLCPYAAPAVGGYDAPHYYSGGASQNLIPFSFGAWVNLLGDMNPPTQQRFYSSLKVAQLLADKQDKLVERYLYLSAGSAGTGSLVRYAAQMSQALVPLTWAAGAPVVKSYTWVSYPALEAAVIPANQVIKVKVPVNATPGTYTVQVTGKMRIDSNTAFSVSGAVAVQLNGSYIDVELEFIASIDVNVPIGSTIGLTIDVLPQGNQAKTVNFLTGNLLKLSYINFLEGGAAAGSTLAGDVITLDANLKLAAFVPQSASGTYEATINGKPWLINGVLRKQGYLPAMAPYKKGDIIWLEPPTYDTQQTPPVTGAGSVAYPYTVPAASAFMGKARTYSAQTNFRQYAVRLRALVDNPRNPAEAGAVGTDWAIDEPMAVVEEGSNANGSYTLYAGGKIYQLSDHVSNRASSSAVGWLINKPLPCKVKSVLSRGLTRLTRNSNEPNIYFSNVCVAMSNESLDTFQCAGVSEGDRQFSITAEHSGTWY